MVDKDVDGQVDEDGPEDLNEVVNNSILTTTWLWGNCIKTGSPLNTPYTVKLKSEAG